MTIYTIYYVLWLRGKKKNLVVRDLVMFVCFFSPIYMPAVCSVIFRVCVKSRKLSGKSRAHI